METGKLTAKGQVTIPKSVRTRLAVQAGDRLAFEFEDDGAVRMHPLRGQQQPLRGFLARYALHRPLDAQQLRNALRERAIAKYGSK